MSQLMANMNAHSRPSLSFIADGMDAWDNPLVYEVDQERRIAVIRSAGQNGIDEDGGSDDIQVDISLGEYEH